MGRNGRLLRAVRRLCILDCMNRHREDCEITGCALYPWQPYGKKVRKGNLRKATRLKCFMDCMNGQRGDCGIEDCSLYPWQPYQKKEKISKTSKAVPDTPQICPKVGS